MSENKKDKINTKDKKEGKDEATEAYKAAVDMLISGRAQHKESTDQSSHKTKKSHQD